MRFNTHDTTPKTKTHKMIKILLCLGYGMVAVLFIFLGIFFSVYVGSVAPAAIILIPTVVIALLMVVFLKDMGRAYVEVNGDTVTVVDYSFGRRKEQVFSSLDIGSAEIVVGSSLRVRGYRYRGMGISYILFFDRDEKYMFKILSSPGTKEFFAAYLEK